MSPECRDQTSSIQMKENANRIQKFSQFRKSEFEFGFVHLVYIDSQTLGSDVRGIFAIVDSAWSMYASLVKECTEQFWITPN